MRQKMVVLAQAPPKLYIAVMRDRMYKVLLIQLYKSIQTTVETRRHTKEAITLGEQQVIDYLPTAQSNIARLFGIDVQSKQEEMALINAFDEEAIKNANFSEVKALSEVSGITLKISLDGNSIPKIGFWKPQSAPLTVLLNQLLSFLGEYEKKLKETLDKDEGKNENRFVKIEQQLTTITIKNQQLMEANQSLQSKFLESQQQIQIYEDQRQHAQTIIYQLQHIDKNTAERLIEIFQMQGPHIESEQNTIVNDNSTWNPLPDEYLPEIPCFSEQSEKRKWGADNPDLYGQEQLLKCVAPATYAAIYELVAYINKFKTVNSSLFNEAIKEVIVAKELIFELLAVENWNKPWSIKEQIITKYRGKGLDPLLDKISQSSKYGDILPKNYTTVDILVILGKLFNMPSRFVPGNLALCNQFNEAHKKALIETQAKSYPKSH
jgi:hypothetical protein